MADTLPKPTRRPAEPTPPSDPNTPPESGNEYGITFAMMNELAEAISAFREAVRLDPKHPGYHKNLDQVLRLKAERDAKEGRIAPPPREVKR